MGRFPSEIETARDVRFGSKCEDLKVSKSSPLRPTKRTLVPCSATSLMGQEQTFGGTQVARGLLGP